MHNDLSNGGCRMTDISTFIKSLKLTWFRRILQNSDNVWIDIFCKICQCNIESICQFGIKYLQSRAKRITNPFWIEFFFTLMNL